MRNTNVEQIKVQVVAANENQIKLNPGQPTIVQFSLRRRLEKNMNRLITHFQIDSEMDLDINPSQKNNNFEVHLKKPIYLNKGAKLALTGISFPNKIKTIPDFVNEKNIEIQINEVTYSFKLEEGTYPSIESLIFNIHKGMGEELKKLLDIDVTGENHLKIIYKGMDDETLKELFNISESALNYWKILDQTRRTQSETSAESQQGSINQNEDGKKMFQSIFFTKNFYLIPYIYLRGVSFC